MRSSNRHQRRLSDGTPGLGVQLVRQTMRSLADELAHDEPVR